MPRKYNDYYNNYLYKYIMDYTYVSGYKLYLSNHFIQRVNERISVDKREDAIEHVICNIVNIINNDFMYRYLSYLMENRNEYENIDVLVFDTLNNKVYSLNLKPFKHHIILKTIGVNKSSEWYYANKRQRMCWIYPDAFKFSTENGNVTWC